jgi:dipeptidyl aminopeptidase/acylaminoacyl peptidase
VRQRPLRAPSRRRLPLLAAGLLAATAPGCIGIGFDLADLPEQPLAIVYRTREESERRVELLAQSKESGLKRQTSETYDASFLRLEAAADLLGIGRTREEKAADLLGRMAAVDARHETVVPFEFAFRGDRPLDWSADRSRLLFASLRSDSVQLYEWDRASGDVRAVTAGPDDHPNGCYLPDGRLAVSGLVRSREAKGEPRGSVRSERDAPARKSSRIYLSEPGGGQLRALTSGPSDTKPACSPDGKTLVYESLDAAGRPSLMAVAPELGATPRAVAKGRDAAFTPDGAFVVYSAQTRAGWRLFQMHPDGQAKRPLGGGPRDEHDPRVSPDGRYVIYVYDDEGRQQLRVRTIDGRKDRPLIWNGDGITPVW